MLRDRRSEPFIWFAYSAIVASALCVLVYAAVQQTYRQSLNDPQIELAEDAAAKIASGTEIDQVVPTQKVDMTQSLAPWLAVYNNAGVPLLSSGELNGEAPVLPQGVFDESSWRQYAEKRFAMHLPADETRFTWQPSPDVRQAVVLVHYDSPNGIGYIAAGRNMREVEERERVLGSMVGVVWAASLAALAALSFLLWLSRRQERR